jgi:UDP-N-acetylglucosamine--N-acetylmuramyl-(pentapeptide) pyrophosphoryl-undecaprenol N-acetylglucosamine transferase
MKIVITTGLSGGHIFPALAFGEHLTRRYRELEVIYIASERARSRANYFAGRENSRVIYFADAPFSCRHIIKCIIINIKSFIKAYKIVQYEKPNAVIGFGSYLSFPLILVAWALRIKTIIHEQNAAFGKANRVLSFFASVVALSFKGTYKGKKSIVTGNLMRASVLDIASRAIASRNYLKKEQCYVLVLGGSQGASAINALVLAVIEQLDDTAQRQLRLMVIAGQQDYQHVKERLDASNASSVVFAFTDEIALLYEKADFVIARAGSGVVFECLAFGLPAIFIPYPFAGAHQKDNVDLLEKEGAAIVLEEHGLDTERLKRIMLELVNDRKKRETMAQNALRLRKVNGCQLLETALLDLIRKGN